MPRCCHKPNIMQWLRTATQATFLLLSFILCASRWKLRGEMLHLRSSSVGGNNNSGGQQPCGVSSLALSGRIKRICWRETLRWPGVLASNAPTPNPPPQKKTNLPRRDASRTWRSSRVADVYCTPSCRPIRFLSRDFFLSAATPRQARSCRHTHGACFGKGSL